MAGLQGKPFAEQGYAFVYSRVRGTGRSQGEFDPFVNERRDGIDVIDWISKQSWCNGKSAPLAVLIWDTFSGALPAAVTLP